MEPNDTHIDQRPGLAVSLKGELPCVACGYELRGVSILGVCPECGTAVRATLLAAVDPLADELQPVLKPRVVATGLLVWVGGFCASALAVISWLVWELSGHDAHGMQMVVAGLVLISGAGAFAIARPHTHTSRRDTLLACAGAGLHLPLAAASVVLAELWRSHALAGSRGGGWAVAALWEPSPERSLVRIGTCLTGIGMIACMRPVARVLVARSLAIRTGRVDRQTMLATGVAVCVLIAGDLLGLTALQFGLGSPIGEWLGLAALAVAGLGALLLVLGLTSSLVDCIRIARAVVRPGPSMAQVLHGSPERAARKGVNL